MDVPALILREARFRGLSERTVQTYTFCVTTFLTWCKKDPHYVTKKDVRLFLEHLLQKDVAGSTLNVYTNALKFFLREILCKSVLFRMKYAKTPKRLPTFLTQDEVKQLFAHITNPTHRLLVELMYAAGLRVSEVLHVRREDIDLSRTIGWVRQGKGNKDRPFVLAQNLIPRLQTYMEHTCPEPSSYLFPGRHGHLHQRSIQEILRRATTQAHITKHVHPHTLRHSFATHLIENGYDVATVQSLLGHSSAQTTMMYVHMASPKLVNVKSPFDTLEHH